MRSLSRGEAIEALGFAFPLPLGLAAGLCFFLASGLGLAFAPATGCEELLGKGAF